MTNAVIDIGSNSVRLLVVFANKTKEKFVKITKLAEGLNATGKLNVDAIKRTADAVAFFKQKAKDLGAKRVYAFATAAVRSAKNGGEFVSYVKKLCRVNIEVISGETEAEIGSLGVLNGSDGGIIDIGGASSEVTVKVGGETVYSYSLNLGGVRLLDACSQDIDKIVALCKEKVKEYKKVPKTEFYGIGGVATSIVAVTLKLEEYDRNKVHGYKLTLDDVINAIKLFNSKTVEERRLIVGLQPERADVILGASTLLYFIMKHIGLDYITVSEDDNLEGYLYAKRK